jgi:phosphoribosylformylglycinamidine cyclo-ligase
MGDYALAMTTDGVGSKVLIADTLKKWNTIGIDCIAMNVIDLLAIGAEPIAFVDYLAVEKVDLERAAQIAVGLQKGAEVSNMTIVGGETASLPEIIKGFDLAGTAIGFVDKEKIVTGSDVKEGDVLIGIASSGIHSNGYSFVRKIFLETLKWDLNRYVPELGKTLGETLLEPTKIYVKLVMDLLSKYDIKAIAHITGGGLIENIPRVIPKGLGVSINKKSWDKPAIFNLIESINNIGEKELHKSFNMGIGLVNVVKQENADEILKCINSMDKGYIIGHVTKSQVGVELC